MSGFGGRLRVLRSVAGVYGSVRSELEGERVAPSQCHINARCDRPDVSVTGLRNRMFQKR